MQRYEFEIFADYFQVYLEDEDVERIVPEWNEQVLEERMTVGQGVVVFATARNMTVPVIIEVYEPNEKIPYETLDRWDHVVGSSIEILSGRLVVMGTTDYYPDAPRINLKPDTYRAVVYFAGQYTLSEDGLYGDDSYLIVLQPGHETPIRVIKQGKSPT